MRESSMNTWSMKLGRDVVIISKAILDQPSAPGQPGLFSHKTLDSNQINLSDYSNFRYFKTSLTVLLSQSSSLILNSRNWATMSSSPILECYFWTVKYFIRQFRSPFSSFSCHGKSNQSNILSERHGFLWSHFYCCCFAVYSHGTLFLWQTFLLSCFFFCLKTFFRFPLTTPVAVVCLKINSC